MLHHLKYILSYLIFFFLVTIQSTVAQMTDQGPESHEEIETVRFEAVLDWLINSDDTLIVYTDGLERIVLSGEFADKLIQKNFAAIRKLCKRRVKTEGAIVYRTASESRR